MITKFLSYIYPLTRKVKSEYNGTLELTQTNGKTVLNTQNTNYSYGSLQRVLNYSLEQLDLTRTKKVLLLGLGGGCVLKTLRNDFGFKGKVVAIDIDPVIIDIADKEFGIVSDKLTEIICEDAADFVRKDLRRYDLIIIDLFIDNKVPEKFLTQDFWRIILEKINHDGNIIFNTLCSPATDIHLIEEKFNKRGIEYKVHRYVDKTNKVLIANCA